MTTTTAPAVAPGGAAAEVTGGRDRWRRTRGRAMGALALVLALGAAIWANGDGQEYPDPLDPRNPGPEGAQALAQVLGDEGVDVTIARSADQLEAARVGRNTTVVVTSTDYLSPNTLERLREHAAPGRLVLVEPSYSLVQEIDGDQTTLPLPAGEVEAACDRPVDGIALEGLSIEVDQATGYAGAGCFPAGGGSVAVADRDDDVLLFGAGQALSNDQVLRADNAAVALRLLGNDDRLIWYVPDPTDAETDEAVTLESLLPDWIGPALWMVTLACIGLILWRFRRLGPLSTEPLPVVVRAVETTRSRGRMYRKSRDRTHAAQALRSATCTALAARLRLDRGADPRSVAEATARHLGRPVDDLEALLLNGHRPPPATDQELVRLAQELARLRREVRRA